MEHMLRSKLANSITSTDLMKQMTAQTFDPSSEAKITYDLNAEE